MQRRSFSWILSKKLKKHDWVDDSDVSPTKLLQNERQESITSSLLITETYTHTPTYVYTHLHIHLYIFMFVCMYLCLLYTTESSLIDNVRVFIEVSESKDIYKSQVSLSVKLHQPLLL